MTLNESVAKASEVSGKIMGSEVIHNNMCYEVVRVYFAPYPPANTFYDVFVDLKGVDDETQTDTVTLEVFETLLDC